MKNIGKVVIPVIIIMLITILGIYYISKEYEKQRTSAKKDNTTAALESQTGTEDTADIEDLVYENIAMLIGKDEEEHVLRFMSVDSDKLFEFGYTGKTPILGKHGNSLTLSEIPLGEIFDVTYSIHSRELKKLQISDEAWTFTDVTKFDINPDEGRMEIMGSTYKLPKTSIVSYRNELATLMDVTNVDTLTVKGYGRKVCSIIVDRGHGYLRLLNDSYFEGGWIEIGQDIIKKVTEDMLIPVPEGDYHVRLTNKGYAAEEDVTIERDKESSIDLSKANIKEVAIGHVEFSIDPDYAQLFIDGEMTDFEERVTLEYGIHHVKVTCAGYKTVETNVRISDKFANVEMALEKDEEETATTAKTGTTGTTRTVTEGGTTDTSSDGTSSSTTGDVISSTRKVYIEGPENVEVYIDGMYKGISPISFEKPGAGSHVITLSKNGYITKSYTVLISDDDRDVTLSFSELVEEKTRQEENTPQE